MTAKDRAEDDRRFGVPARISEVTHREMRYVSARLDIKEGGPVRLHSPG